MVRMGDKDVLPERPHIDILHWTRLDQTSVCFMKLRRREQQRAALLAGFVPIRVVLGPDPTPPRYATPSRAPPGAPPVWLHPSRARGAECSLGGCVGTPWGNPLLLGEHLSCTALPRQVVIRAQGRAQGRKTKERRR